MKLFAFLCALCALCGPSFAQDLVRLPAAPQAADSYVVKLDKQFLDLSPDLYANIATSGTTVLSTSAGKLDRVTVGTAGAAGASVVLKDGTNTIATCATTSVGTFPFNAALTTGTLTAVTTGTANITILYR